MTSATYHIDCHVHTCYSGDSQLSLERLIEACSTQGIHGVCITDHNTIAGAVKLAECAPFPVVIGEEIMTTAGEIIGYFLEKEIPAGLSPQATVAAIKDQGGLVAIPHPFDRLRWSSLKNEALMAIVDDIDIIEVFNSRTLLAEDNRRALKFCELYNKIASAGSDCHIALETGYSYVKMNSFTQPVDFLHELGKGDVYGKSSPLLLHFARVYQGLQLQFQRKR